jgi:hypothetical protein
MGVGCLAGIEATNGWREKRLAWADFSSAGLGQLNQHLCALPALTLDR